MENKYEELREFLKSSEWVKRDELKTPKDKDIKRPLPVKEYDETNLISLPNHKNLSLSNDSIKDLVKNRKSRRKYNNESLTLKELSFLLWTTQGVRDDHIRLRTVPSGGAVHPFETYLYLNRVEGIKPGLYRYIPGEHALVFIKISKDSKREIIKAANKQKFVGEAAVVFMWTVIPKRGEWKYGILAHKLAAIDVGHLCQNLYLATEAINAGMCAVDAYDQKTADSFLEVDGKEEFVIYMAPVGKYDE
jgi:SagB-type dehydrogenase family enzyme